MMFLKDTNTTQHWPGITVLGACYALLISILMPCADTAEARESVNAKGQSSTLKIYDTHGLEPKARPYALTEQLSLNMPHKKARQFIKLLPTDYQSAPLRNLVISALIARIDADSITKREGVPAEQDLLTLRLEALNAMGAYTHAFRLYAALDHDIAHPALLKAGIRTQLGLGRHSLACLEAKAGIQSLKKSSNAAINTDMQFWQQMQKFCHPVIGQPLLKNNDTRQAHDSKTLIQLHKDRRKPKSWTELNTYSAPQIAAIMREHADILIKLDDTPHSLTSDKLAMLTHIAKAPMTLQYEMMQAAAQRNLVTRQRWRDFLANINSRLAKEKPDTVRDNLPDPLRKLLKLSKLHKAKQRGESIPPASETADIYGNLYGDVAFSAILAFESLLKAPSNADTPVNTRVAAMAIHLRANRFFDPEDWGFGQTPVNDAAQFTANSTGTTHQYELLALFALRNQDVAASVLDYFKGCSRIKTCRMPNFDYIQSLSLFSKKLKSGLAKAISTDIIYDNEKWLTFRSRYVIPSFSLRRSIKETNVKKGLGKTIFLGTLALHREEKNTLEPSFTASVLTKLSNEGKNRFGRDFAITYLIGQLEKKGV